jgi:hypothetical protein
MERNVFTPEQEKWLAALESGEWKQCREALRRVADDGSESYCCLGVANLVCGLSETNPDNLANTYRQLALYSRNGLVLAYPQDGPHELTAFNDNGWSFAQIAAFIRANPWQVFGNFDAPVDDGEQQP